MTTDYVTLLQRHTLCAEVHYHPAATFPAGRLVDYHIEWMSDETFEIAGLRVRGAHGEKTERIERDGWLCEIDIEERELAQREARRLR